VSTIGKNIPKNQDMQSSIISVKSKLSSEGWAEDADTSKRKSTTLCKNSNMTLNTRMRTGPSAYLDVLSVT
jgi:hypothetical protein